MAGKLPDAVRVVSTIASNIVCGSNALRRTEHSRLLCASPGEGEMDWQAVGVNDRVRLDLGPFIIAEFVAHDSRLRFRSLNLVSGSAINPLWPMALPLML
jgi:hypothetical protein